jgi:hypothetical protein
MKAVEIYVGQPIGNYEPEHIAIILKNTFPDCKDKDWLEKSKSLFKSDAEKLEKILLDSLPGGTYDALLGEMLKRKASSFVVSFGDKK